jgi:hypothetical protein
MSVAAYLEYSSEVASAVIVSEKEFDQSELGKILFTLAQSFIQLDDEVIIESFLQKQNILLAPGYDWLTFKRGKISGYYLQIQVREDEFNTVMLVNIGDMKRNFHELRDFVMEGEIIDTRYNDNF